MPKDDGSPWDIDSENWRRSMDKTRAAEAREKTGICESPPESKNRYFTVNDRPVKFVILPDGGMDVLALNMRTGEFERDMNYLTRCVCGYGDVDELDEAQFLTCVAVIRGR